MKKIFNTIVLFVVFGHYAFAYDIKTGTVMLELKSLPDDVPFYLLSVSDKNIVDTLEIVVSEKGQVRFKSELAANGQLLFVCVDRKKSHLEEKVNNSIRIFIDRPVAFVIRGDMENWPLMDIIGSNATAIYENYHRKAVPFLRRYDTLARKMSRTQLLDSRDSSITVDSSQIKMLLEEYRFFCLNYFKENINELSTPLMVLRSQILKLEDKKQLLSEMSGKTRESYYGKWLKKGLVKLEFSEGAVVDIDKVIPDIKMKSVDGNLVSIRELVAKSEFTLLDFWAYWCGPCKAQIPKIKEVYEKFKDKGFNVLGVSTDANEKEWFKSLKQLDTKWDNVIDNDQITRTLFSMAGIPAYIVVNRNAEIIAMNIVGNKKNGASSKYFAESDKVYLDGKSMHKIIEELINNKVQERQ